jgi:beta-glucosidase
LKNENDILPLSNNKKILVTGPNANSMRSLNGGWSYSWLGDKTEQYAGEYNTILEAVRKNVGEKNVIYSPGVAWVETGKYWEEKEISIKAAVRAARKADYILLCVGENSYTEKPGDTHDLALSDLQISLAKALQATGKPVILVLNQGRPRIINRIDEKSKAILMSYLPGNFGGDAIADVIFGKQNPSGKLPYTYPKYPHSHVNYWHKYSEEQTRAEGMYNYESDYSPLYEFGHGLSYTTFEYSNLKLSNTKITEDETLEVSVDVRNTGKRDGKEAVLLYLSDLYASLAPDMKRLKGFEKIELKAGETKTVKFKITKAELSFVNIDSKTIVEPGNFEIKIGNLKAGFELTPSP